MKIQEQAPAKINLALNILGRRTDGYHELRMVMQSVSLHDTITLETGTGRGLTVETDKEFLPTDERNLAAAAALRFCEATGVDLGGLALRIEKRIPVCAGMAGGSTDAAAVLRALNQMTGVNLPVEQLAEIGERVGSDVPYCVLGGTALAEGRGERLTPLPSLPKCHLVLCKPAFPVSTPELFGRIDSVKLRCRPDTAGMLEALERQDLEGVARRLYNVFEDVLPERKAAEIASIRNSLIQFGALGACMSGTGPTVFGIFDDPAAAHAAWEELSVSYRDTFLTQVV